jgi:two-component system cell cycle response regulator
MPIAKPLARACRGASAGAAHMSARRAAAAGGPSWKLAAQALADRAPALALHQRAVAQLTAAVGARAGLADEELDRAVRAAELHDIGKIAVPDSILQKPGTLTDAELEVMRRHSVVGERILARSPQLRAIAPLVRASHERWDGKGYPDGLAGEEIPLGARIISICDAYDAMTHDRPYRPARSAQEALAELHRGAGRRFDPRLVAVFLAVHGDAQAAGDQRRRRVTQ